MNNTIFFKIKNLVEKFFHFPYNVIMSYEAIAADFIIVHSKLILKNSVLLSQNGRIINHLPLSQFLKEHPSVKFTYQKNSILSSGFINAHTHLELSFLGGYKKELSFFDWVESNIRALKEVPLNERIQKNTISLNDAIKAGTIGFGDVGNTAMMCTILEDADIPHHTFIELLGFREDTFSELWKNTLSQHESLLKKENVTLSAHSLYSLSKSLLRNLARQDGLQSIHIDELASERKFLKTGRGDIRRFMEKIGVWDKNWKIPQKSPYDYLKSLAFSKKTILIHNLHINEQDLLKLKDFSFVLCPRSNQFLHHKQANYTHFKKLRIPFALGTDSLASNHDLSILNEMKFLKQESSLSNEDIFSAGSENGAQILSFRDYGSLKIGKKALCNLFCYDVLSGNPLEQLLSEPFKKHRLWGI